MAADSDFDKVTLLLHGDGSNGSTSIIDSSSVPKTLSVYGGGSISTTQSKFGGSSIRTNAGGLYVSGATDGVLSMGNGDFTVEMFIYPNPAGAGAIINNYGTSDATSGFVLQSDSSGRISAYLFYGGGSSYNAAGASGDLASNVWQHLAVERYGTTMTIYLNGSVKASVAVGTVTMNTVSTPTRIGMETNTGSYPLTAYFDEVRVTKGLARYKGTFTPPTAPFEGAPSLKLSGTVKNASDAYADRLVRAYVETTGAFVGQATSNATTGYFEIPTSFDTAHTLVFYPADGETLPALVRRGVVPV